VPLTVPPVIVPPSRYHEPVAGPSASVEPVLFMLPAMVIVVAPLWAIAMASAVVASWNGRVGAVTMTLADVTAAGGAPLASPTFTGAPAAPTPAPGDSSTKLATTAFVAAAAAAVPYLPLAGGTLTGALAIALVGSGMLLGATVLGSDDSIESHVRDTQDAGAGIVDEHAARFIAEHSDLRLHPDLQSEHQVSLLTDLEHDVVTLGSSKPVRNNLSCIRCRLESGKHAQPFLFRQASHLDTGSLVDHHHSRIWNHGTSRVGNCYASEGCVNSLGEQSGRRSQGRQNHAETESRSCVCMHWFLRNNYIVT